MIQRPPITEQQKDAFIAKLGEIIKDNTALNGIIKVAFYEVGAITKFMITDNEGRPVDIAKKLTPRELDKYVALTNHWQD